MPNIWTHGSWTVKVGREEDFVAAWRELARAAASELDWPEPPTLLRDRDRGGAFVSFGPWRTLEDVERFRQTLVAPRLPALREMLESFEAQTLDEVARGG